MIITDYQQLSHLYLVRYINGDKKLAFVERPFVVQFRVNGDVTSYCARQGFGTDFASVPKIVPRWIFETLGPHLEAAVIHDQLCVDRAPWSSRVAAEVFLAGMVAGGTPAWLRQLMYRAVVNFGPQWSA